MQLGSAPVTSRIRHPGRKCRSFIPDYTANQTTSQLPACATTASSTLSAEEPLGAYPSLVIGPLLDSHQTDIGTILRESLESEGQALALYKELLALVENRSVMLEEYARQMIHAEEMHAGEVAAFRPGAGPG